MVFAVSNDVEDRRRLLGEFFERFSDEEMKTVPEEFLRDLHLKKFWDGVFAGPMERSVFRNKPWAKNILDKPVAFAVPKNTLFQNYMLASENHLDDKQIFSVRKNKWFTNREIIKEIDLLSGALKASDIGEGSKILSLMEVDHETMVTLFASSKLGSTIKFENTDKSISDIEKGIEEISAEIIIADEAYVDKVKSIEEKTVVVINATKDYSAPNFVAYEDFLKRGDGIEILPAQYVDGKATLIISSSGTTGPAKPIVHTDYSINNAANIMFFKKDSGLGEDKYILNPISPYIGLGIITTMLTSMLSNTKLIMIDGPRAENYLFKTLSIIKGYELFRKNAGIPEDSKLTMYAAPIFYKMMAFPERFGLPFTFDDLSMMGVMLAAGSKMTKNETAEIRESFRKKGCNYFPLNCYGQNEQAGYVTGQDYDNYSDGSGGYPGIGVSLIIADEDNNIVDAGIKGNVLERSTASFLEYGNLPEKTKEAWVEIADNSYFITHDIAMIDSNGMINITGRKSRTIDRMDHKIPLEPIDEKFRNVEEVRNCGAIIDFDDEAQRLIMFVSIDASSDITTDEILEKIQNSATPLGEFEIPDEILIVDIPMLVGNKVDFKSLSKKYEQIKADRKN